MPERETAKDVFEAMQRYQDDVYRAALMATGNFADAEDILQDVFLKYYQSHPVFASPSHEKAWLLRCAINAGHDLRRSIWVSRRADAELDSFAESAGEEHSDVLRAVLHLPEAYRTAVYLFYFEGYPVKQIARMTNSTESAVEKRLSRARAKLKKQLGGDNP